MNSNKHIFSRQLVAVTQLVRVTISGNRRPIRNQKAINETIISTSTESRIKKIDIVFVKAGIFFIMCYKASIGRYLGGQCRFVPSCSDYAIESLKLFGFFKGAGKSIWRILRCNPFGGRGYDSPEYIKPASKSKIEIATAVCGQPRNDKIEDCHCRGSQS